MKVIKLLFIVTLSVVYFTLVSGCANKSSSPASPVQPVNQLTLSGISETGIPAHPGSRITLTVTARSQQNLALTYTWTTTGNWSVVAGGTTPTATIQAPDVYGSSGTATVIITDPYERYVVGTAPLATMNNALPVISMLSATPNPVARGGLMALSVSATDEVGNSLSYSWAVPDGWIIQSGQGTPDIQVVSPYQFGNGGTATVTIDDGFGGVVSGSIVISTAENALPVINSLTALPNPVSPGSTISAVVSATDPDGDRLSYTWTTTTGWSITFAGTTATLTAPLAQGSGGSITVTIADPYGAEITGTIPISTSNAPLPPYNLLASAGDENIGLTWSTQTPASSYTIYELTSPGMYSEIGVTTTTAYKVTGLTNWTQYTFVVTGVNASGESIYSNQAQATPEIFTYFAGGSIVDVAVAQSGNIVVSTWSGIAVLSPDGMLINQFMGTNAITYGLAIDAGGNVWGTDDNSYVVEFSAVGAQMASYNIGNRPAGLAIDGFGNMWVANSSSNTITELGASVITCTVGNSPQGIAADASGNIWVTNSGDNTVSKVTPGCFTITTYPTWAAPAGIAIDQAGHVWIADSGSFTVTELDANGGFIANRIAGGNPQGIAIDAAGNVWISSSGSVTELSPSGTLVATYSLANPYPPYPQSGPQGIAIDQAGNVWVAVQNGNMVAELKGIATGPEYFPFSGPQFAGGGNF